MTYNQIDLLLKDCEQAIVEYITKYPSSADDLVEKATSMADRIYQITMQIDFENQKAGV